MTVALHMLRHCFEGAVPSAIATCGADGMPNVAKLSHVHYLDDEHVALSYQFFNRTRENILHNGRAMVEVVDPIAAAHYNLKVEYVRTETSGPTFEYMKARIAAIASHSGMSKVFRLLGADIYRVLAVDVVPGYEPAPAQPRTGLLSGLRMTLAQLGACSDLERLLEVCLDGLERHWKIDYAMLLVPDPDGKRLFTVASRGYPQSGIGSEVRFGEGIVGVVAGERTPIRIGYALQEYRYSHATRERFVADGDELETEIPFPGLAEAGKILGKVLSLLADHNLNVLDMLNKSRDEIAYNLIDVECEIPPALLPAIRAANTLPSRWSKVCSRKSSRPQASTTQSTPAARAMVAKASAFAGARFAITRCAGCCSTNGTTAPRAAPPAPSSNTRLPFIATARLCTTSRTRPTPSKFSAITVLVSNLRALAAPAISARDERSVA